MATRATAAVQSSAASRRVHQGDDYLTQSALEEASLHVNEDAPGLAGEALERLVNDYRTVMKTLQRLSRLYPLELTEHFIYLPRVTLEQLADHSAMQAWLRAVQRAAQGR